MKWPTIDTAPRDGTYFLFWSKSGGYFCGNWPEGCFAGVWLKGNGRWIGKAVYAAEAASHWMPLPPPPEGQE